MNLKVFLILKRHLYKIAKSIEKPRNRKKNFPLVEQWQVTSAAE